MTVTPKVSVIIPTYNVKNYIAQCLKSVQEQTLRELEILIGDGGSEDGTLEFLQHAAKQDSRIVILSKKGSGYGQSVNECMDAAKGEYIGIVESDDFVDTSMLERLYAQACKHNADIVKSDYYCFFDDANGKQRTWKIKTALSGKDYHRVFTPSEETRTFRFGMNTWCGIYRRTFLNEHHIRHNQTPGGSYQDNGFWFQSFALAERVVFVPEAFYYYRQDNPNSSIHSPGKVFAICDEYAFIRQNMSSRSQWTPNVEKAYWLAMFGAYMFSLNRVGDEFKLPFLHRMRQDFLPLYTQGAYADMGFSGRERKLLTGICDSPEKWYQDNVQNRAGGVKKFIGKLVGLYWCVVEHGFGYTIGRVKAQFFDKIFRRREEHG